MLSLGRLVVGLASASAIALAGNTAQAAGACSPYVGTTVLNEYNHLDDFVEIKRLNTAISLTGWKVRLYSAPGTYILATFPAPETCGEYSVFSYASNQTPFDSDIVLLDQNDDVVDILRTRTSLPASAPFYMPYPSCGFISPPTDVQIDPSRKAVDRTPDGVGAWRITPGTGAGSFTTRCSGNTPGGTAADLRVTKAVSAASIPLGGNVSFTVTITNLGPNAANSLVTTDLLPAGLSYASHIVTAGTYNAATGLWTLGSLAVNASQTLTLVASGTAAGALTNTAIVASDNTDPNTANNTASAAVTVLPNVGSFNAVDVGANALTGKIWTKIAGQARSLDIYALNSAGTAVEASFGGVVQVALLGNTSLGVALDANNCPVSSTVLSTQNVTLASGKATLLMPAIANAWRDVRARITYSGGSPAITRCSSDNFAIRPNSLSVSVTDLDWQTTGTTRVLNNTSAGGGVVHKAGRPFTITATAYNAAAAPAITTNYAGTPVVASLSCTLPTPTCANGTLSPGAWNGGGGIVVTTNASYSEVGAFSLGLLDTSFAAVDAADGTPASCNGYHICAPMVVVGRFVPDRFELTASSIPQFKTFNTTNAVCAARSFTYVGQPFGYAVLPQVNVVARNAAGGTTANYRGALWKLVAGDVSQNYASVPTSPSLTASVSAPTLVSNNDGTGTITMSTGDRLTYARTPTPPYTDPFNANLSLTVSVQDSTESSGPITGNALVFDGGGSGIAFDAGNVFRYGRVRLVNAHGSERLALQVLVRAEYYNGSLFVANADNCTRFTLATDLTLGNYQRNLNAGETTPSPASITLSNGAGAIVLSAPGVGNSGSVDLTLGVPNWLQFNWTGTLGNPKGRATFGIFGGGNQMIYRREYY